MLRLALICAPFMLTAASTPASDRIHFDVHQRDAATVELRVERSGDGEHHGNWSQSVRLDDLQGLARTTLDQGGRVAFRLKRPAGALDCQGLAHDRHAAGECTLALDSGFARQLNAHGVARPTTDEAFQLTMSGVAPDVLDALHAEGWEQPTVKQLVELGIFHVTAPSIHALAGAGYRGGPIKTLTEFAIFKVTPDFIASIRAAGLHDLPAATLVQLRIFNVTPDDVRAYTRDGRTALSASQIMELRMAGVTQRDLRHD